MERDANAKCNEAAPRCVERRMLVLAKDFWSRINDVAPSTLFRNLPIGFMCTRGRMSNCRNGIGRPSTPSLRARNSRLLDDEPRVQARGAVVLGRVRSRSH